MECSKNKHKLLNKHKLSLFTFLDQLIHLVIPRFFNYRGFHVFM
jgi:hypothetical protein